MLSATQYALCETTKFIDCMIELNNKIAQAYQVRVRTLTCFIITIQIRIHACKYTHTHTLYIFIITDAFAMSIAVIATSTDAIAVVLVLIVKQKVSSNIDKHDRKVIDKRASHFTCTIQCLVETDLCQAK